MSAWHWLKEELVRLLGEEQANQLWAEYWRRYALDQEQAKADNRRRWYKISGDPKHKRWLEDRGYRIEEREQ